MVMQRNVEELEKARREAYPSLQILYLKNRALSIAEREGKERSLSQPTDIIPEEPCFVNR